jgi:hypothetical protein
MVGFYVLKYMLLSGLTSAMKTCVVAEFVSAIVAAELGRVLTSGDPEVCVEKLQKETHGRGPCELPHQHVPGHASGTTEHLHGAARHDLGK